MDDRYKKNWELLSGMFVWLQFKCREITEATGHLMSAEDLFSETQVEFVSLNENDDKGCRVYAAQIARNIIQKAAREQNYLVKWGAGTIAGGPVEVKTGENGAELTADEYVEAIGSRLESRLVNKIAIKQAVEKSRNPRAAAVVNLLLEGFTVVEAGQHLGIAPQRVSDVLGDLRLAVAA